MNIGNKPGAGMPVKVEERRVNRCFVASDSEWKEIKKAASNVGVSISQYIREMTIVWREK